LFFENINHPRKVFFVPIAELRSGKIHQDGKTVILMSKRRSSVNLFYKPVVDPQGKMITIL